MTPGAIACPHVLGTEAGSAVLRRGGNAIDAAIAASAALTVVYPHMCAVGGDLIALVAGPGTGATVVNGSGAAPVDLPVEGLRRRGETMPLAGPHSITVPGAVGGWSALHALGAGLPFGELLEPAIGFADEGVPVAPSLASALESEGPELFADPGIRATFAPSGSPLAEGAPMRQPRLAETLRAIATDGPGALYGGAVGAALVAGLRRLGSTLAIADMETYEPERTAPLVGRFDGLEVLTAPPNSQGFVLIELLAALAELAADAEPDPALVAQLFRLASRDRDEHLADPRRAAVPLERLLSPAHRDELLQAAGDAVEVGSRSAATGAPRPSGDTVAVTAVDGAGRAVTVIESVFHAFGARILEPETGVVCHNRGSSFSLRPGAPNALAPGKRPAHTLMPVILRSDAELVAQGTMGGRAQPQIHAQLLLARRRGLDPQAIVGAPRFVVGGLDEGTRTDVVLAEPALTRETAGRLAACGIEVVALDDRDERVGHAQIAALGPDGFAAGTDPRADGKAAIVQ